MLGNTPGTTKSTPSLLGQNFDGLIHEWKLFQHLISGHLIADRLADSRSKNRLPVRILPSQNGIQLLSSSYVCFWVFVKESAAKRFIHGCLCDSSCGILRQTTGKIFLTFQSFCLRVLPLAAKKWNTAAIKILLLFEPVLFIWFRLRKVSQWDFNESKSWACRSLQQSWGKAFFYLT